MKIIPLLLILSLTANLLLGVMLWRRDSSASRTDATTAARVKQPHSSTESPTNRATSSPPKPTPLWTGLKSDAIGDAIARLRAAGCPPREIAAAASAMIDNLQIERFAALGYANATLPYWKQFQRFDSPRPPNDLNILGLEIQRLRRIHLLSPELYAANEELVAADRHRYGNLDTEKLRRLAIIDKETAERTISRWLSESANPGESRHPESKPGAREEIDRQRNAAITATLTANEYAQYELRDSRTANMLRFRLDPFRPTEEEYKALFALEKAKEAQLPPGFTHEQGQAARTQYEAAVLAALGPERAADYDALQKAGGDTLPRLVARLDLPLVTVSVLNTVRSETSAQAKTIMSDSQLSPAQRTEQLNALVQEAESRLSSALGSQRAVDAYKDLKGEWLRTLRQTAAPSR